VSLQEKQSKKDPDPYLALPNFLRRMINMKKYLIALVLGLVLILALATTVALADNGPHGGFTASTDACAGCHRVHTAQYGSNSLLIMDPEALCLSCHDGTGASTNVEMGVYTNAAGSGTEGVNGGSLFGGGFTEALMATAWSGNYLPNPAFDAVSTATTSSHNIGSSGTIWGSGANNSANGSMVLECTSCHDPHGNAGWNTATTPDTRVASYRLLRWQPSGSSGFTAPTGVNWSGGAFPSNDAATPVSGWLVPDNYATLGTEWYTIGTQTIAGAGPFAVGDYLNGSTNNVYQPYNGTATQSYIPAAVNAAFFCAQCHDRYFNNSALRNAEDESAYCGAPVARTVNGVALTVYAATVTNTHPVDAVNCLPNANPATRWWDNRPSGDTTYTYRHASGDIRASVDGTIAAGAGTSLSRSCMACHVSHGTSAKADAVVNTIDFVSAAAATLSGDSALLRMDGRTQCLRCHAPNYTVGGTIPLPVVDTITPASGSELGGTSVVIAGHNFLGAGYGVNRVSFGATNYSIFVTAVNQGECQVDSDIQITCITKANAVTVDTPVNVVVRTTGSTTVTVTNGFTFLNVP
jgi:predicted CXXCH cytochrome family protein